MNFDKMEDNKMKFLFFYLVVIWKRTTFAVSQ